MVMLRRNWQSRWWAVSTQTVRRGRTNNANWTQTFVLVSSVSLEGFTSSLSFGRFELGSSALSDDCKPWESSTGISEPLPSSVLAWSRVRLLLGLVTIASCLSNVGASGVAGPLDM